MAATLPYLASYKNVASLFEKIAAAKIPDAFSQPFLYQTLGLKSKADRALIPLLRTLGFIDAAGKPSPEYSALKNRALAPGSIAEAVRRAYAPLFEANENANAITGEELKGLVAQVAGTDDEMTKKIVGTFNALLRVSNFGMRQVTQDEPDDESLEDAAHGAVAPRSLPPSPVAALRPEFHYNLQVHLPSNATEEVYLSIFNALRRAFQ